MKVNWPDGTYKYVITDQAVYFGNPDHVQHRDLVPDGHRPTGAGMIGLFNKGTEWALLNAISLTLDITGDPAEDAKVLEDSFFGQPPLFISEVG